MSLRKLASETAIYGMTTIVGRLLNYLLVPLHTRLFVEEEYGVVTDVYAYVGFLIVLFSYRMESAFFRYGTDITARKATFRTATFSLAISSIVLCAIMILFSAKIALWLHYPHHQMIIVWVALILALDTMTAIPFALLRMENRPRDFGRLKIINIIVNIIANLVFLLVFPRIGLYSESIGVGYIFIAGLLSSAVTFILILPVIKQYRQPEEGNTTPLFDDELWQKMMRYALPLVFVGLAGMINEVLDRIILKYLLPGSYDHRIAQVGIYGACYKLAMLMTMFTQAFNFAAEPFFFKHATENKGRNVYAQVAKAFTIIGCLVMLGVLLYLDLAKYFIGEKYRVGLGVVPILLMANLCLGLYYSVGAWYKLADKTIIGTYISLVGAAITIIANVVLIPHIGFMGSAWATLICYASMLILTWFWGQKYFPVPYDIKGILWYITLALAVYTLSLLFSDIFNPHLIVKLAFNTLLLGLFTWYALYKESINILNYLPKGYPSK